jgi:peroxiredoxin
MVTSDDDKNQRAVRNQQHVDTTIVSDKEEAAASLHHTIHNKYIGMCAV